MDGNARSVRDLVPELSVVSRTEAWAVGAGADAVRWMATVTGRACARAPEHGSAICKRRAARVDQWSGRARLAGRGLMPSTADQCPPAHADDEDHCVPVHSRLRTEAKRITRSRKRPRHLRLCTNRPRCAKLQVRQVVPTDGSALHRKLVPRAINALSRRPRARVLR